LEALCKRLREDAQELKEEKATLTWMSGFPMKGVMIEIELWSLSL
jgi:hypothetical protein